MPNQLSTLYGPTGNQELQNRFAVEGDPRPSIPILAAGGLVSNAPAHTLGLSGTAYRYGTTTVASAMNLAEIDGTLVSLPPFTNPEGHPQSFFFNLGKVAGANSPHNVIADSWNFRYLFEPNQPAGTALVDGEWYPADSTNILGQETFTSAGTVTVTNGSSTVTGAGTAFTTAPLSHAYVYTPAQNHPLPGDVLKITHPVSGTVYYRIASVTDATHLILTNVVAEATASGVSYTLIRTGFGSYSRVVTVVDFGTNNFYHYYAGLLQLSQTTFLQTGSIMCDSEATSPQHQMSQTGVTANDIILYKSFLLYGANNFIGWSQAGFPLAFPFGDCSTPALTDFPAANISVQSLESPFVSFEKLGDQLVAFFRNKIVLCQATGSVPEFQFYDLPEPIGSIDVLTSFIATTTLRPTCSARGAAYYLSSEGLQELSTGGISTTVSGPVDDILPIAANLHWDPVYDAIIIETHGVPLLVYYRQTRTWGTFPARFGFGVVHNSLTDDLNYAFGSHGYPRRLNYIYYDTVGQALHATSINGAQGPVDRPTADPDTAWTWASGVLNFSDIYTGFQFGGLRIDAESMGGSPSNLMWTLYGGASPYSLTVRNTGTMDYSVGTPSSRDLQGTKMDDPWFAVTLSGSNRVKLMGVSVYNVNYKSRR